MVTEHGQLRQDQSRRSWVLLLLCSILNLASIRRLSRILGGDGRSDVRYTYRGHDFPPELPVSPPLGEVLMRVEESVRYPVAGWLSDAAWVSLAGSSFGYVRIGSVEGAENIAPAPSSNASLEIRPERMFAVTGFHELHCLRMLNGAFQPSIEMQKAHVEHCLGYLRNMALCDADLTLEQADWEGRYASEGLSGARDGGMHVCRDWERLHDVVKENWKVWWRKE